MRFSEFRPIRVLILLYPFQSKQIYFSLTVKITLMFSKFCLMDLCEYQRDIKAHLPSRLLTESS